MPDYKSDVMSVLFDFRPDLANNDGHIRVLLDEYSSRYLITGVWCLRQKPKPPRVRIPTCIGLSFWTAT